LSRTTLAADADWAIRGNAVWRHECIPSMERVPFAVKRC
jgi:hypothetical protein